jgi:hypothetical protein
VSPVDALVAAARARTGLVDLGADSWHEGLTALLDGADEAATFNELGIAVLHDQAVGLLSTRLSVEDWYRRHPEIDDQVVPAPLVGLGLPRTGSTALSFLLAQDRRSRSLSTWEADQPTPPPEPATYETDPRIAEAAVRISLIDEMAPRFKVMLPSSPTGPTECLQLLALDFRSAMFGALGDNRGYERWLATCDMVPGYEYHERVLKLLQWRFPPRPWRLKSPAHMGSIADLVEVYPDARFVMTHRDITQVIPSLVSLFDATSEMLRTGPLAPDFAANQAAIWEHALRTTLAYRDDGHEDRFFDIDFADLQVDPLAEVGRLYDWLGVELSEDVTAAMLDWWAANPPDKQGAHEYRPEDHGIDVDALTRQFAFYNERFARPRGSRPRGARS